MYGKSFLSLLNIFIGIIVTHIEWIQICTSIYVYHNASIFNFHNEIFYFILDLSPPYHIQQHYMYFPE